VIVGTAIIFDEVVKTAKHSTYPLKAAPGPTSGLYILLSTPLIMTVLPLTSSKWKKANSRK
jgi:hypothetical protein